MLLPRRTECRASVASRRNTLDTLEHSLWPSLLKGVGDLEARLARGFVWAPLDNLQAYR